MRLRMASYVLLCGLSVNAYAQTSLTGASLALKSLNSATLASNSYAGTYLVVPAGGATVNFTLNATASSGATPAPHLNIAVADTKFGFNISSTSATDYTTSNVTLPAGTYFIRNERDYTGNVGVSRSVGINNLSVNTVSGSTATFSNLSTSTIALAASNTYINNFRKGNASVALKGPGNIPLLQGTPITVDLARHAFNFGGTASGVTLNDSKDMLVTNPTAGSEAAKFQSFINSHFNTIVGSNGGKWAYNEATQNSINMTLPDRQMNYAQSHNMRFRMHNLLWGSGTNSGNQQPAWVNTLIANAAAGDATAKTNLRNAITNRIAYYVNSTRAPKAIEIDVLNEAQHNPAYWNIYGAGTGTTNNAANGIAGIHNEVAQLATAAGNPNLRLYLNEWNVLQYSPASVNSSGVQSGSDLYANWYRDQIEAVRNAGGNMGGVGIQYYASVTQTGTNAHSAATIEKALQNMSVQGLPISMTEFGLASGTTKADSQSLGPAAMEDTMRMFFGNPQATTFMIWGWWDLTGAAYPPAALLDNTSGTGNNAVLTPMGTKWEQLMSEWDTNLTSAVNSDGAISFNGFYGDYNIAGGSFNMNFAKGTSNYNLNLATPTNWSMWNVGNSGTWSSAANWTGGGVANSAGQTAYFGSASAARTVTVDSTVIAGMLALNSSNAYAVGGPGTIQLQGYNTADGHAAAIYVAAGSHSISANVQLLDNATITTAAGSSLVLSQLLPTSVSITKGGSGILSVNGIRAGSLSINAGTLSILPSQPANATSVVSAMQIASGARLDLSDQALVVDYAGASPLASIRSQIVSGFAGGLWNGSGMLSGVAAASQPGARMALGYAEASELGIGTFCGVVIDSSSVLVGLTWAGDATMDGFVDTTDFNRLANNFGGSANWVNGDFNYDGLASSIDFDLLLSNYGKRMPAVGLSVGLGVYVPEPGIFSSLLLFLISASLNRYDLRRRLR